MVTQELKKYIREANRDGVDEDEIIESLLNVGWSADDIDVAVNDVLYSKVNIKQKNNSFSVVPLAVIIFIGFFAISGTFYASSTFVSDMDKYLSANVHDAHNITHQQSLYERNKNKKSTMIFVGDIMLSSNRGVGKQINKEGDYKYPFLRIVNTLKSSDLTFGNLEGPISSRGKDNGGKYSFRAVPEVISGLTFAGFDVLSVANNHIFDWGEDAFIDTLYFLKVSGIESVGGGINSSGASDVVIKNINGTKVAFLAYSLVDYDVGEFEAEGNTPGKSSFNEKRVIRKIKELKNSKKADIVAISFHWGKEYKTRSSVKQQKIAHRLIEAGADIIIGHHPHVVQEIERYKNGWIAYSLGNFVFDQSFSQDTMRGLMLEVEIKNKKIDKVNPIEIQISDTFQPYIKNQNENL
jgi:poly-gamma-glutamate synthesis protein (capsule biosynthesis protein)